MKYFIYFSYSSLQPSSTDFSRCFEMHEVVYNFNISKGVRCRHCISDPRDDIQYVLTGKTTPDTQSSYFCCGIISKLKKALVTDCVVQDINFLCHVSRLFSRIVR